MKKILLGIMAFAVAMSGSTAPVSGVEIPQIPINAVIFPIYKPDFDSPGGCSKSSITVSRNDQKDFADYDIIEVGLYTPQNTLGVPISSATKNIVRDSYTNLPISKVSLPITLCVRDLTGPYVKGEITEVEVRVTYKKDFRFEVGKFSTRLTLLNKTPEAAAIEKMLDECDFTSKEGWNAVIVQSKSNVPKGKPVTLSGTFFRSGIPAPNDVLRIYQDFETDPKRGNVKLLATSTTDKDGVFKFTFIPKSKIGTYTVTFQARTEPIGPVHGPFDPGSFIVDIECKSSCNYKVGGSIVDWIPKHTNTCLSAYENYETNFVENASASFMYGDDDNRIPFLFRKVFVGSKGKKSYFDEIEAEYGGYSSSSAGSSSGSGAKRCWVSGYTTKTGKRVSGYWRSC